VKNGAVVPGGPINLATIDFLARGGDCYPLGDIDFVRVGQSYQQALASFVADGLGGTISAADYPAEGTGRVSPGIFDPDAPTTAPEVPTLAQTGLTQTAAPLLVIGVALVLAGVLVIGARRKEPVEI